MKLFENILVFLLQVVFISGSLAQDQRPIFRRVPPPPGSAGGSKVAVQDAHGYMWIGSYQTPLRRFDGYTNTYFSHDPQDSNSLATNSVEALCAARNGFIWIGTYGFGLDRLQPETGEVKHFRANPKHKSSLTSDTIHTLFEDRQGLLWIGTARGLDMFDPKTGQFHHYYHDPNDPSSLSCNRVMKIYEDRQGTIWVGTGMIWKGEGGETNEGGLNRLDRSTNKFTRYLHEPGNPQSLINNKVKAIFEDSRGTFWIGTADDGLHTMNRSTGTFTRHTHDVAHPEKLSRPPLKKVRTVADDHITFIIEDAAGSIWIGTFGNGVSHYNPKTNKVTHYPNFKDPETGVQLEIPWWACTSRDGILWIGYWRGLYTVDPIRRNIPYYPTGKPVNDICEDQFGFLWYATDDGLIRKNRITREEIRFIHNLSDPYSLSNSRINSIYKDRRNVLWIATSGGLNFYDRRTEKFRRHVVYPGNDLTSVSNGVNYIYEDRKGLFWLGSGAGGVIRKNMQTGSVTHFRNIPGDTNSFSKGQVYRIYEDKTGRIWIGTRDGGLNLFVPETETFQHFLPNANIHSICQDSDGLVWVGTSTGLYVSNKSVTGFSRYSGAHGEFAGYIIINGILEDNQKALWINATPGICRLDRSLNKVTILSRYNDPLFHNGTGTYKGKNGELFLGGGSGYFSFSPQQIIANKKAPEIVLSAFRVADKEIVPGKTGILKKPLSQTTEIRLKHNQDVFSFDFAGIHYSLPAQNKHQFILEGLDYKWREANEEKTASYYNVPPARYVFRVKAANSDGVWAEKSIVVIVSPPWWTTWWFRISAFIIAIVIVYSLIHWRLRQSFRLQLQRSEEQKRLAIERSEKNKQVAELQNQKTELEMQALRAQMNPHFIFNSLNSINSFILQNDKAQASEYLTKFSKLVRLILQNSQASAISLESELECLHLYLELEAVRFNRQFDYSITVAKDLDISIIKVPPMIIQPYAENAIWHGLMHKEDKGHLEIEVTEQDDTLCVKITDDGIGRKKAAELKSKSASNHKSMGMRITADRIAMLQKEKQSTSYIHITDLVLPDGISGGTEVFIKIPIQYD